jgi:hypothetical protein
LHWFAHTPQLSGSVAVVAQVGAPASDRQRACGAGHVARQVPLKHAKPTGHALSHAPQLLGSVSIVAQVGGPASGRQRACGAGHVATQVALEHAKPAGHALWHAPQFSLSVRRSTQAAIAPHLTDSPRQVRAIWGASTAAASVPGHSNERPQPASNVTAAASVVPSTAVTPAPRVRSTPRDCRTVSGREVLGREAAVRIACNSRLFRGRSFL